MDTDETLGFKIDDTQARELVFAPDPILNEVMPAFDFLNPIMPPEELTHALAQTCHKHKALGLSAPQINIRTRALIIRSEPMICMFNPKIVAHSDGTNIAEEACLSIPDILLTIKRYNVIRVRYTRPNTDVVTEKYEGMTSRIIQHEIDHLDGILFTHYASRTKLEMARKRKEKWDRWKKKVKHDES